MAIALLLTGLLLASQIYWAARAYGLVRYLFPARGTIGLPMRAGMTPEIAVFELVRKGGSDRPR